MSLLLRLFGGRASRDTFEPVTSSLAFGHGKVTTSGEMVSPDSAMTLCAYFASIRAISEDIAKLPACAVERIEPRGRRPLADHVVTRLFDESFSPSVGSFTGRETLLQWALGWGNGCAHIERDGNGRPLAMHLIHPTRLRIRLDAGRLVYDVRADDTAAGAPWVRLQQSDVFHLRGPGDQYQGWSIARLGAETFGASMAARDFGASFFRNDTAIGAVISFPNRMDEGDRKAFRASLSDAYAGAQKAGTPLVLDNGAKIDRLSIAPEDAQLLDLKEFDVEEVARWFRIPPHKIGHLKRAAGWSTLEMANTDYVVDCLQPWAVRIEREAQRKLIGTGPVSLRHYFQGLLRGDFESRTSGYSTMLNMGAMTPNEIRELEDMNPATDENADRLLVQGALVRLDSLGERDAADRPAGGAPPPPPGNAEPEEEPEDPDEPASSAAVDYRRVAMQSAMSRLWAKESKAFERRAEKHREDAPAFERWARSFYEELRGDFVSGVGPILNDEAQTSRMAAAYATSRAKQALAAYAARRPLTNPTLVDMESLR